MKKFLFIAIAAIVMCSCSNDDKKDTPPTTGLLTVNVNVKSQSSGKVSPIYKRVVSGEYYVMDAPDGTPGNGNPYYYSCKFLLFDASNCEYDLTNMRAQAFGTILQKGLKDKAGNYHPNLFKGGLNDGMYRFNSKVNVGKYCIIAVLEKDRALLDGNSVVGRLYSATVVEVKETGEVVLSKTFLDKFSTNGTYEMWEDNASAE